MMNSDGTQPVTFGNLRDVMWFTVCGNYVVAISGEVNSTVLTRMDLNGSHITTLATGTPEFPSCSREGTTVYYANWELPQKIWRVPLEGGTPAEVAPVLGNSIHGNLSVSPNDKFLAYQFNSWSAPPLGRHIAIIPAHGGPPLATFAIQGENLISRPYWTPDSSAIQYLRVENQVSNIWEQRLTGGTPKQLTFFTSGHIVDFAWSADRTRLYFTKNIETTEVVLLTNLR